MGLKTFNVDETVYKRYSGHCKKEGISMSKRIEGFMRQEIEKIDMIQKNIEPEVKITKNKHPMQRYC